MEETFRSLHKSRLWLLSLSRPVKRGLVACVDLMAITLSVWLAYYMRLGEFIPLTERTAEHFPLPAILVGCAVATPLFLAMGLYRVIFRFVDYSALKLISKAVLVYAVIYIVVFLIIGVPGVPRTIGLIQPLVFFSIVCGSRFIVRFWLSGVYVEHLKDAKRKKVLIYGAGAAGRQLVGVLGESFDTRAVGFIDDDINLQGQTMSGLPVFSPSNLAEVVKTLSADEILLAIPSAGRRRQHEILERVRGTLLPVRTLPSYYDLIEGRVTMNDIRELSIDEILGREVVEPDPDLMSKDLAGKSVLVTGAGGSIGSELCRQIMKQSPLNIVLFEQSEFALYSILQELSSLKACQPAKQQTDIVPVLGSVLDKELVRETIRTNGVKTIYHTAAYKHLPLVESNPLEGLKNNVFGTQVVARLACELAVEKFVLISTDKAVRPTSIMGASKRIAEIILQTMSAEDCQTNFAMVRFGNVLDSSGSVVPLFRRQISQGGPVTVTHEGVERYFMTVSEAAQLVIQAGAMTDSSIYQARGAPIYVLEMGEPVKILDLAKEMIGLYGLSVFDKAKNPNGDIEIQLVGLRPGEKLCEELLIDGSLSRTKHKKILLADELSWSYRDLEKILSAIRTLTPDVEKTSVKDLLSVDFPTLSGREGR